MIVTRGHCGNYTYRNSALERIMAGNGFLQDSTYYVQIKASESPYFYVINIAS